MRPIAADRSPLLTRPGTENGYDGNKPSVTSYDAFDFNGEASASDFSPNHGKYGHNLLMLDTSVKWTKDTDYEGDNIWLPQDADGNEVAAGAGILSMGPGNGDDVFLVP